VPPFKSELDARMSAMPEVEITVKRNGPYVVSGPVVLKDADGNTYPAKSVIALCRCGASTTKPFCDGTHSKVGFQAAEQAVPASKE
jgi:3-phenylpropionate/trans-cinnamate dioxygenase ferredoxin subunit